eukprot:1974297-Pyramimonas_sp.AAC.2
MTEKPDVMTGTAWFSAADAAAKLVQMVPPEFSRVVELCSLAGWRLLYTNVSVELGVGSKLVGGVL